MESFSRYITSLKKYFRGKKYWYKYHPLAQLQGKIFDNASLKIMLANDTHVRSTKDEFYSIYDVNVIVNFLNENYSDTQFFSKKYLDWLLNTPHKHISNISHLPRNKWNIGLDKSNDLIGSMCIRPMVISVSDKIMLSFLD